MTPRKPRGTLRSVVIGCGLPWLLGTAWFGALAFALTWLPVLAIAGNRLALGDPLRGPVVLGGTWIVVLGLSALAVLLLVIAVAAGGWNFVEGSRTRAEAALPVGALSFGKALSGEVQPEVA